MLLLILLLLIILLLCNNTFSHKLIFFKDQFDNCKTKSLSRQPSLLLRLIYRVISEYTLYIFFSHVFFLYGLHLLTMKADTQQCLCWMHSFFNGREKFDEVVSLTGVHYRLISAQNSADETHLRVERRDFRKHLWHPQTKRCFRETNSESGAAKWVREMLNLCFNLHLITAVRNISSSGTFEEVYES